MTVRIYKPLTVDEYVAYSVSDHGYTDVDVVVSDAKGVVSFLVRIGEDYPEVEARAYAQLLCDAINTGDYE